VAISHFRGQSNDFIIKFTKTGTGTSHEALLYNSRAMGQNRKVQVYAKIAQADVDQELYFLLRCMVKAGEAENTYTARSGRPTAWLILPNGAAPYSFSTVMEIRAMMGPDARKEEARRIEEKKESRCKRALDREAVGSGLKEAIREMGMMEDIARHEAGEKGIIQGGGIRMSDKADVVIFRGLKLDSVPAWAEYGQGGGRGQGRGGDSNPNWDRGGARGGQGSRVARGRGCYDSQGHGRVARGRGRGSGETLSGSNLSRIGDQATDRKRKPDEDGTEEAKRQN
jgi:hypothetical protein